MSADTTCDICGVNSSSSYICPRCNIKYCSSACYKNQKHLNCSEAFFKQQVFEDIASRSKQGQPQPPGPSRAKNPIIESAKTDPGNLLNEACDLESLLKIVGNEDNTAGDSGEEVSDDDEDTPATYLNIDFSKVNFDEISEEDLDRQLASHGLTAPSEDALLKMLTESERRRFFETVEDNADVLDVHKD